MCELQLLLSTVSVEFSFHINSSTEVKKVLGSYARQQLDRARTKHVERLLLKSVLLIIRLRRRPMSLHLCTRRDVLGHVPGLVWHAFIPHPLVCEKMNEK